jgi:L-asparaginase
MPATNRDVPEVSLFTLGGTIASVPAGHGTTMGWLRDQDLLSSLGDIRRLAQIRLEPSTPKASANLRFSDVAALSQSIRAALESGSDGIVVAQGTDTLEATAFQLDLLLDSTRPVVLTGALRNPTLPGADGAANLLSAIRVAASAAALDLGVTVVMNDEIHAARFVRKMHTHKPSAFASPCVGPLGWIAESRVRIALRPAERLPRILWKGEPPAVPVVSMEFSASPDLLSPYVRDPPAGIVVAALGAGHVPLWAVEPLGALAAKIPVVLTSRIGVGEIFRESYDYAGSETDLLRRGCVPAGYLDVTKAHILLSLLLADGADRSRIADAFSHY